MARAKAVMFDIDGTLIRTGGAGVKAFNQAGQTAFGIRDGTLHMKFAGRTDTGLVREFFKHHQLKPTTENFQHFLDTYIFWLDHMLPQSSGSICPGVIKLIRDLRRTKNPPLIGLLTGNIRLGAEIKLRQYNLWEEFELGAFADDSEDRSHIAHTAHARVSHRLGHAVRGEEIIVIGDTPHDVSCGKAIGAKVLAVATGGATYDEIYATKPDWCVKNLTSISAKEICG